MNKLLHDRLRNITNSLEFDDGYSIWVPIEEAEHIADEIERYYIPLPCDPEGKPWKIGDEAISGEGETFIVQGIGYTDGQSYLVHINSGTVYDAEWCKRPRLKILDTDGVEIEVGDTVWDKSGNEWTIGEIWNKDNIYVFDDEDNGSCFKANSLTHKEPVLDADGVPINVGDTVYVVGGADDGKRLTVKEFVYCDGGGVYVSCGERTIIEIHRDPSDLTHKEPDSLEKLRDDVDCMLRDLECDTDTADEIERRFSALIERGA